MSNSTFSGILSRKAGMRRNSANVTVSNHGNGSIITGMSPEGKVVVIAETTNIDAIGESTSMQSDAQDAVVIETITTKTPESKPKAAAHKAAARKAAAPKATAPKATAPKEATPKAAASKEATPKEASPKAAAPKTSAPKTAAPKPEAAAPKAGKPRFTLIQYSEKSLALFGDTKSIKEELKRIGGRYNPHLHPFAKDQSVPGWVFSNKAKQDLEDLIANC